MSWVIWGGLVGLVMFLAGGVLGVRQGIMWRDNQKMRDLTGW